MCLGFEIRLYDDTHGALKTRGPQADSWNLGQQFQNFFDVDLCRLKSRVLRYRQIGIVVRIVGKERDGAQMWRPNERTPQRFRQSEVHLLLNTEDFSDLKGWGLSPNYAGDQNKGIR